jgi:NADH-quinone oxidoreductase subunit G
MESVTLTIDGKPITVAKGTTVLQAAIEHGFSVPYYCYHPGLGIDGSCRVCLVRIEKMAKLQTACSTLCTEGMVVATETPDVVQARAGVFEFLLVNHPLDCPVCDKGGECPLQDFSYAFGPGDSRMEFPRRTFDGEGVKADVDFGPTLMLNRNRCILCTRCVRFMDEIDADPQIGIVNRGNDSQIATFEERGVHSLLSGNLMDVCPVGAITTRDYRFKSRPWDNPDAVDTICTLCSKGCSTTAWIKAKPEWAKGARLVRFTPRYEPAVNDYWMCDIGRFDYHWIESEERLQSPLVREAAGHQQTTTWDAALRALGDRAAAMAGQGFTFLISAHASNEEIFLVERLASAIAVSWTVSEKPQPAGTKFKVPAVNAPNVSGARDLGLPVGDGQSGPDLTALRRAIEAGQVPALYGCRLDRGGAAVRHAVASDLSRRARDRARPRGRHRPAGLGLGGEGRHLHQRSGPRAGVGQGVCGARRRARRPGDLLPRRESHRAAAALCLDQRRARCHCRGAREPSRVFRPGRHRLRPPGDDTALAAGEQPVGALEVGLHVPGSQHAEVGRPYRVAAPAQHHPVDASAGRTQGRHPLNRAA